ncbi:unnamed protein product [Clonostachys byssicola]|uniref:Uncharacterized protein n=1 Tax=Clonostachys byssicola TaxID=160290 RepID=A0A9N9UU35_9HYPO|nr:unnamed protein product [Clonostachys byssicola]
MNAEILKNKIPQFIKDLHHPFAINSGFGIDALDIPAEAFCNPDSLERSSSAEIPSDLFKRIKVSNEWKVWSEVDSQLSEILDCQEALNTVKEFQFHININETSLPPSSTLDLFVQLFDKTRQMKTLTWEGTILKYEGQEQLPPSPIEQHFTLHNVQFPGVTTMILDPNMHFLVHMAPNLQSLSSPSDPDWVRWRRWGFPHPLGNPTLGLVKAASGASKLREFDLVALWTNELTSEFHQGFPVLETIQLHGSLDGFGPDGYEFGEVFNGTLEDISHLKALTKISLPFDQNPQLGLEFPDCEYCSAVEARKLARFELTHSLALSETVANIVVERLPKLKRVCFQRYACTAVVSGERPTWPWTGKLREYVLEASPRFRGYNESGMFEEEDPNGPVLETWEEDQVWFSQGGRGERNNGAADEL